MPADTEIRRARPEEWPVYRQVRLTALAEAPYAFMSTLEQEQGFGEDIWRQRLGSPTAATFLAWREGEPAGTATGKTDDPADEYAVPDAWQLVGMWVDPRARGLGVADELVDMVANHARAEGGGVPRFVGYRGQRPGSRLLPADRVRAHRCAPAGQTVRTRALGGANDPPSRLIGAETGPVLTRLALALARRPWADHGYAGCACRRG